MMRIVITLAMLACVFASNEYYQPEEYQPKQREGELDSQHFYT